MTFPKDDHYWTQTLEFLRSETRPGDAVLAPREFAPVLDRTVLAYEDVSVVSDIPGWVAIHAGLLAELPPSILDHVFSTGFPAFVGDVFIVFSREKPSGARGEDPRVATLLEGWRAVRSDQEDAGLSVRMTGDCDPPAVSRTSAYLGRNRAVTRTTFGQKMFVDTRDVSLTPHLLLDGHWELWISRIFRGMLRPGMNVVEIGANIGYYTLLAADGVGDRGSVHAFEANPAVFETLFRNIELNGFLDRVTAVNRAVSDRECVLNFDVLEHHHVSSGVKAPAGYLERYEDSATTIQVPAVSLDQSLPDHSVDLIKIDAEGSEPRIFRGMTGVLSASPDVRILCEFVPDLISAAGDEPRAFLDDLEGLGFRLRRIDADRGVTAESAADLLRLDYAELLLKRI